MGKLLYLVAGERSGDTRGAELIAALGERHPEWRIRGWGGPEMRALAGEGMHNWVEGAGVVGLWEVLKRYRWFKARFEEVRTEIGRARPNAVVFIDYPGFNLRLARALREGGTSAKLIDYISPQVWAWNQGRIPRMAEWLDLMVCLFPFERELFEEAGLRTVCMGHPMVDQLEEKRINGGRDENLVGLFPGSREREVARHFPVMLKAVHELRREYPQWHFEVAAPSKPMGDLMKRIMDRESNVPIDVVTGQAHSLMQRAQCGVVASGTATLEATYYGLPYCLIYKVAWPTYWAGRAVVKLNHLGMANILAGREIVHEFIQTEASSGNLVSFVESIMTDPSRRRELTGNLLETAAKLGERGAARRGAEAIAGLLEEGD